MILSYSNTIILLYDTTCPCLCLLFVFSSLLLSCLVLSLSYLVLSALCVVLGVFWGHFWSSWGSFWALGAVLGRSWEVLEALGAVLGRVDGPKGGAPEIAAALESIFGPILGAKKGPRRSPKRPKIYQKNVLKNDRF